MMLDTLHKREPRSYGRYSCCRVKAKRSGRQLSLQQHNLTSLGVPRGGYWAFCVRTMVAQVHYYPIAADRSVGRFVFPNR